MAFTKMLVAQHVAQFVANGGIKLRFVGPCQLTVLLA